MMRSRPPGFSSLPSTAGRSGDLLLLSGAGLERVVGEGSRRVPRGKHRPVYLQGGLADTLAV